MHIFMCYKQDQLTFYTPRHLKDGILIKIDSCDVFYPKNWLTTMYKLLHMSSFDFFLFCITL